MNTCFWDPVSYTCSGEKRVENAAFVAASILATTIVSMTEAARLAAMVCAIVVSTRGGVS